MRKGYFFLLTALVFFTTSMMPIGSLTAQGDPGPPPSAGLFGMPPFLFYMPGDSIDIPVEFFETVLADSQVSGVAFTIKKSSVDLTFDDVDTSQTALDGWSFAISAGGDSLRIEATAPGGVFFEKSAGPPVNLFHLAGILASSLSVGDSLELKIENVHLITKGLTVAFNDSEFSSTKIFIGSPPPPPGGGGGFGLFSLSETVAQPDSNFAIGFMLNEPVPADSQLSRIRGTLKTNPPNLMWASTGHELSDSLSGWSLTTTGGTDSLMFDLQAPSGTFLTFAGGLEPFYLVKFFGEINGDAPFGDIDVLPKDFFLTTKGVESPLESEAISPGKIFVTNDGGPPPPSPGAGNGPFAFTETVAEPDSQFALAFGLLEPVPADSQVSRIRGTLKAMPPNLVWATSGHKIAPELSGWTFSATGGADSLVFDFEAPSGTFLTFEGGGEPMLLIEFIGEINADAPLGPIDVMPKDFFVTVKGVEEALDPGEIGPGKIYVGAGGGPPPPPPPPPAPPTATTEGRTNLGLYGGTVLDMAFDETNGIMLAAVAAPQSVFMSADSGLTWSAAFPEDSLEFLTDFQVRGFGGRAMQVESSNGYSYSRTSQEAGTLTGSQITEDGVNWRTLLDGYQVSRLLQNEFSGAVNGPSAIEALSANGPVALVSSTNFVFRTTDAGGSWNISVVPNASALATQKHVNILKLRNDDSSGNSFYVSLSEGMHSPSTEFYRTEDGTNFTQLFIATDGDTAEVYLAAAAHPLAGDTLWVTTIDPTNPALSGIWRSYDAGDAWTRVFEAGGGFIAPSVTIYEDPAYPGPDNVRLFLVGENKYSDDLGDTWNDFSPQNDPYVPRVSNANAGLGHIPGTDIYFSQGDGSPARSTDGKEGFYIFVPTGIEGITIWDIAQIPGDMDKVYLATSVGIAYTSVFTDTNVAATAKWVEPNGNYPINPSNGGNTGFTAIAIDPNNTSHIIAANGNGIFVSETGGFDNDSWNSISYNNVTGLDEPTFKSQGGKISQISFMTSDSIIAALSTQRVMYGALILSTDGGATWATMPQAGNHSFKSVIAAWNSAQDSLVLFASGGSVTNEMGTTVIDSGAVYKSLDWGATWARTALAPNGTFNPAPFPLPINEIMAKPGSLDTLYMACGENLSNAIVRTFDGGYTLESIGMAAIGPREGAFEAVAINKNHPDSIYFAIRRDILVYDAVSDSATTLFRGYPGELTHTLLYDELTMGSSSGFYAVDAPEVVISSVNDNSELVPTTLSLAQNYPNPFNPSTNISFKLPLDANVKLEIFNILGQRVQRLLSENRKAGTHSLQWRPERLASGIYIYRLEVLFAPGNKQILSKKLMFLK